ncbi:MAG: ergothioneine biosynthesis protein EgtB [Acidobacteria bacterium]|nr:MAG: ergothioneine biosynthesis protein EgtB [Acidobacteriota bacterium]
MPVAQNEVEVQHELLTRIADARTQTDRLFEIVKPEALYDRPIPERHRIVFYIGHLEAFDWNLLRERVLGLNTPHPDLDDLFAFGIDPVDGGLPADRPADWPAITDVRAYVTRTRESLDTALREVVAGRRSVAQSEFDPTQLLNVAIEHRLMHAETLAYMFHQLPLDRKTKATSTPDISAPVFKPTMVEIPEGAATLGLSRDDGTFGWDNEYERNEQHVPSFAIDQYKVTNGDYLKFMQAGGYQDPTLWKEADWQWKEQQNISHPVFWKQVGDAWLYCTMFDEVPLPLNWPVYVSHAEANAYAHWAGKALPTEAQWHRAAYSTPAGEERQYPWGSAAPNGALGNFDFHRWEPTPVNSFPDGQSACGVRDLLGNGWEWTSTEFAPFPGFEPFSFYPGYSANFFDGKHYVIKGGSARTAACMLRRSFRNWFQPHYQYVYAGFRCVSR